VKNKQTGQRKQLMIRQ